MTVLFRKIAASLAQILIVSALAFFLFNAVPGDFYSAERANPQTREKSLEDLRRRHDLDRSWLVRYRTWLASCARGDFGTSLAYGIPVTRLVLPRIGRTVTLVLSAWLLAWTIAMTTAVIAAWRTVGGSAVSRFLEPAMTVANMLPEVIVVSLLTWTLVAIRVPLTGPFAPLAALLFALVPLIFLHAFSAFSRARDENFVRLAESRGIKPRRLWARFILPAAAHPLIALIGPSLVAAISSSLIIEAMTGWPGLGPLFLEAVQARDYEIVQSVILLLAIVLTFTNLFADLLLFSVDPRIRLENDVPN
jgi:peptide/nickel transport system permease protein